MGGTRSSTLLIFFFFLAFPPLLAVGQTKADSVRALLDQLTEKDTLYCYQLGKLAFYETNPELKKAIALELITVSRGVGYVSGIYNGYYYLGLAEKHLGNTSEALEAFLQGLDIGKQLNRKSVCEMLTAIADVYARAKDSKNAIRYYHQAIYSLPEKAKNIRERETQAIAYMNLGETYRVIGFLDSALHYSIIAHDLFEPIDRDVSRINLAYATGNIGLIYAAMGNHSDAEHHIQQAVRQLASENDYYAISIFYTIMADIYLERGEVNQALNTARESLEMALEYDLQEQVRDAHRKLYEVHKQLGNYEQALQHHEEYLVHKDSLLNLREVQRMSDLRTEYEVGQKQAEVDLLLTEKHYQELLTWAAAISAMILSILAAVSYKYYLSKIRVNKLLEKQKEELERLNATKDKFFSIISHDLRGPVSSFSGISGLIKMFASQKDTTQLLEVADDIDTSVTQLSRLLDNLLNWALQQQGHFPNVPERLEMQELGAELISNLRTVATAKHIQLEADFPEGLTLWADRNSTMTIFRNLVSNALKFTPEGGRVWLSGEEMDDFALIQVHDNGVGISRERLERLFRLYNDGSTYGTAGEKGLGLGLQLVQEFVQMNGGALTVESEVGQGTVFTVALPLFGQVEAR